MHIPKNDRFLRLYKPAIIVFVFILYGSTIPVHAAPVGGRGATNPWTSKCPGNNKQYGVPRDSTATASARRKVFGPPYPYAKTEQTRFMGKNVTVNKKIVPCLKAVEWELQNFYHTDYTVKVIYGASEVNSQNPVNYFHAYGGAVDINPAENPYCDGPCGHNMPSSWVAAFENHGFFWGGHYRHTKDYMHFEWHGQR